MYAREQRRGASGSGQHEVGPSVCGHMGGRGVQARAGDEVQSRASGHAYPSGRPGASSTAPGKLWLLPGSPTSAPKNFRDFLLHRILRHMHKVLNIDKKDS